MAMPRRAALLLSALLPGLVAAQAAPGPGIYTCIDNNGRRLTADRPIAECRHKEQQILNRDGSVRGILPPTLTAEERAEKEARDRAAAEARAAAADAVRRDRNLMARYPSEEAHQRAREAALDNVRLAIRNTDLRLRELEAARKPLLDEAEFYAGKALPPKLRSALDANDAAVDAQRNASATQTAELDRINRLYDSELERLRRLWAGAPPGSMGPLQGPGSPRSGAASASGAGAPRP
jgi:hypothetical protein